jgi:hypothetical protein
MHNYTHHNLSFEQLWMFNKDHLPNRTLRNAETFESLLIILPQQKTSYVFFPTALE